MSQDHDENTRAGDSAAGGDSADRREAITEVEDELDAQADGEGLAAEAGRSEENGLAEG